MTNLEAQHAQHEAMQARTAEEMHTKTCVSKARKAALTMAPIQLVHLLT